MSRPIVTLTSDFGTAGYYVGAMRGVVLARCPEAQLVDITHDITPYSPLEASIVLEQACREFPPGTVHLAVVDPGVGGVRKPLVVRADGFLFVGPDNGIFTPFLDDAEAIYRILPEAGRAEGSPTFDGRDLFAPAAGRLANGEDPAGFAEPVRQAARLRMPQPQERGGVLTGRVLFADRFGNLITNIHARRLAGWGADLEVTVGTQRIRRLARTYEDGDLGESLALIGSSGYLEVAVVQGNAGAQLGVGKGERVRVHALHPA